MSSGTSKRERAEKMRAQGRQELPLFDPEDLVLVEDPKHPLYDKRVEWPVDEAMVLDIMENGVLEPVLVRPNGERNDGTTIMEIVAGRRRIRAAREANKRLKKQGRELVQVSAVIKRGEDKRLFGIMISENEIRQATAPLDKAELMARGLDMGMTKADLSGRFGLTAPAVEYHLKMLDLTPEVKTAIATGKIRAVFAAKELSTLPREEQGPALAKLIESGATKGAAAEEMIERIKQNGHAAAAPVDPKEARAKKRMRSRPAIEALKKTFGKLEGRDAKVATAVLAYVLGSDRALQPFAKLSEALAN